MFEVATEHNSEVITESPEEIDRYVDRGITASRLCHQVRINDRYISVH